MTTPNKPICILCNSVASTRFTINKYTIVRCAPCDLEFVSPTPSPEEIQAIYQSGYFQGSGFGYHDYFGTEQAISKQKAVHRLSVIESLGISKGSNILDVGCADGVFLSHALLQGYKVSGVEPSTEAIEHLPSDIRSNVYPSLTAVSDKFHVVTFWDSLEHLVSPQQTLREISDKLHPGALVAVVLPVIDNINARLRPRSWDQYKPPEHLWYFSRKSLKNLLCTTLNASVVFEQDAWTRYARLSDVAFKKRFRTLATIEEWFTRKLCRFGVVEPESVVDSVMVVVKTNIHVGE